LAEEHLLIKDARGNDWVVGTTLDYGEKCTKVNIFNAKKLNDGPSILPSNKNNNTAMSVLKIRVINSGIKNFFCIDR
jgi:hypothetical protein